MTRRVRRKWKRSIPQIKVVVHARSLTTMRHRAIRKAMPIAMTLPTMLASPLPRAALPVTHRGPVSIEAVLLKRSDSKLWRTCWVDGWSVHHWETLARQLTFVHCFDVKFCLMSSCGLDCLDEQAARAIEEYAKHTGNAWLQSTFERASGHLRSLRPCYAPQARRISTIRYCPLNLTGALQRQTTLPWRIRQPHGWRRRIHPMAMEYGVTWKRIRAWNFNSGSCSRAGWR